MMARVKIYFSQKKRGEFMLVHGSSFFSFLGMFLCNVFSSVTCGSAILLLTRLIAEYITICTRLGCLTASY